MNLRDGVRDIEQVARAQLRGQFAEPGHQRGGIIGGELPYHAEFAQVPVRIFHRQTGLSRPSQPAQGDNSRAFCGTWRKPGFHLGEQFGPARQEGWPGDQPHGPAGDRRPVMIDPADRHPAAVGHHGVRSGRSDPGSGYLAAGPGLVGFPGDTFPWIVAAATPPPEAVTVTSRPAATP